MKTCVSSKKVTQVRQFVHVSDKVTYHFTFLQCTKAGDIETPLHLYVLQVYKITEVNRMVVTKFKQKFCLGTVYVSFLAAKAYTIQNVLFCSNNILSERNNIPNHLIS